MTVDDKQSKETSKTKDAGNLATKTSLTELGDMSSYTDATDGLQITSVNDDGKPAPLVPTTEPKPDEDLLYVAKYDFSINEDNCLNFKKGDVFYMLHTEKEGWWLVRAKHSGQEGYIPNNFVAKVNTLDAEE